MLIVVVIGQLFSEECALAHQIVNKHQSLTFLPAYSITVSGYMSEMVMTRSSANIKRTA